MSTVGAVPFSAADIWAGRTFLTRLSKGSGLGALAFPTDTVASVTAHLTVIRNATVSLCRAVAVVSNVTSMALALPTVTLPMA